eukprot:bmy_19433T0
MGPSTPAGTSDPRVFVSECVRWELYSVGMRGKPKYWKVLQNIIRLTNIRYLTLTRQGWGGPSADGAAGLMLQVKTLGQKRFALVKCDSSCKEKPTIRKLSASLGHPALKLGIKNLTKDHLSASCVEAFPKGTALKSYRAQTGPLTGTQHVPVAIIVVVQRGQARSDDSR